MTFVIIDKIASDRGEIIVAGEEKKLFTGIFLIRANKKP